MSSILLESAPPQLNAPLIHQLPNGLTIIAEQMPIEAINLSIWLNVGSVVEPNEINGMAHFLEHMVFKGTPKIRCGEFERLVEERGAMTNAATSQDYTQYYITTAPKDFHDLAPLQIDVVMNPLLDQEAFERERPVILEEIRRANDNPRRRMFYRSMEALFDRLPYRRPVLGPSEVIEGLTAQQMREFHNSWYQPSAMTAVAVGNLPATELIDAIAHGFEQAEAHRQQLYPNMGRACEFIPYAPEPSLKEIRRFDYVDESIQQARLVIGWRVPGMQNLHDTYALDVLATILGRGRMARLVRDLREERGIVTSISASNMTFGLQGSFYISAQLPVEQLQTAEQEILQHIRQMQQEPVTEAELSRIRTQVANRYVFGNETPSDRAGLYGFYHSQTGDLVHALNYPAHIQAVDADAIQQATQHYLSPEAYAVVTMRPA
ncbi:MAG: M16 family metallopeptidase [Thainema sp.]